MLKHFTAPVEHQKQDEEQEKKSDDGKADSASTEEVHSHYFQFNTFTIYLPGSPGRRSSTGEYYVSSE